MEQPWVEKYRPKTLDEIVGQEEIVKRLKKYVERKSMPHLLFSGPPGVGKTTAALCLARDLFGENWRENFLELNASVSKDTPLLVKIDGEIKKMTFEDLDNIYFKTKNESEMYKKVNNLEVLTVDDDFKVKWMKVSTLIRHKVDKVLRVKLENSHIDLTGNHSVMVIDENGLTTKKASEIKVGDCLLTFNKKESVINEIINIEDESDGDTCLLSSYSIKYYNEVLPAEPIVKIINKSYDDITIPKDEIINILEKIDVNKDKYNLLKKLAYSDLHALVVKDLKIIDYNDFVYDVSVPNNEMFFAGEVPILLHNSDERGIDVIRTKVKEFARTKPIGDVPFKIIFLDESDALTADAQNALRRTMEKYSNVCRFILSCNYPSKIIPPIQSRCAIFRFSPLKREEIAKKLKEIAEKEGLELTPSGLDAIIYVSEGDLRKAINVLQTAAAISKKIDDEVVYKVSSRARPEEVKKTMNLALEGKFSEARDLLYKLMVEWGMSGEDILNQMFREVGNLDIDEKKKVKIAEAIGETDFRIVEGANERIQLSSLLAKLSLLGKK
ncbi:replication factor C small subunit [Methanocaldococcus sp.]